MEVATFDILGPLLFTPSRLSDERGFLSEIYSARRLEPHLGAVCFVQQNHTFSEASGTLRGLHFQIPPAAQGKLVRVVRGAIFDVAVDIRLGSPTFGRHIALELTAASWNLLWVPSGFAHGFCTLEARTAVEYKLTDYYSPEHDRGLLWKDPSLAIPWPLPPDGPILSPKDSAQPLLAHLPSYFHL